jgi:hypothetical protein
MFLEFNVSKKRTLSGVKIETYLKLPKFIWKSLYFFYAITSAAFTDTIVLSALPFLNSTNPSVNANKVKSFPTPTFLPGW